LIRTCIDPAAPIYRSTTTIIDDLQVDDQDAVLMILVTFGFRSRLIDIQWELEARLRGVGVPALSRLFASANLLDDERR
jgi:hypothetical protein